MTASSVQEPDDQPAGGLRSFDVAAADSPIHGRGVFALRRFAPDELIEVCPVIALDAGDRALVEETAIGGYVYEWADDGIGFALGCGSLYNHSWRSNARYEVDFDAGCVRVYAVHEIADGAEITINYTGVPDGEGDLWFEPDEPRPTGTPSDPDRHRRRRHRRRA